MYWLSTLLLAFSLNECTFDDLHCDVLNRCMQWNTQSEQRNLWRLVDRKSNIAHNITDYETNHKITNLIQFINKLNFSVPDLFHQGSSIDFKLATIMNGIKDIRLSPQFIKMTPYLIRITTNNAINDNENDTSANEVKTSQWKMRKDYLKYYLVPQIVIKLLGILNSPNL